MPPRAARLAVGLLIVALTVWCFAGVLLGNEAFAYRDAAHYYGPLLEYIQQQWASGQVPLWNPQTNLGVPLLGDPTSGVLYPGKLVFWLPLSFAWNYRIYVIGHVLLAAFSTYLLARRWQRSIAAAGLAALAYAFGGSVLFQYANVIFLVGAAWLPLACLAADAMLVGRSLRAALGLGVVLALMVLGGDPQAAYHAGLLAVLEAVLLRRSASPQVAAMPTRAWACRPRSRPVLLLIAAATAFFLAAVQILPSWEFSQQTTRTATTTARSIYEIPGQFSATPGSASLAWYDGLLCRKLDPQDHHQHVYHFSVGPWRLAELLWPNVTGREFPVYRRWIGVLPAEGRLWTPSLYLGLLPLLLSLAAWRLRGGDARTRWMSWTALLGILASFGWYGVGWIFHEVTGQTHVGDPVGGLYWLMTVVLPGYVLFRYPAKLLVVAALGLSLLAAEGWDRSFSIGSRRLGRGLLGVACVSAALGLAALAIRPYWAVWLSNTPADAVFGPLDAAGAYGDLLRGFWHTAIVAIAFFALLRSGSRFRWMPAAALVLVAVDLAVSNGWLIATTSPRPPSSETAAVEALSSPRPLAGEGLGVRAASDSPDSPSIAPLARLLREDIWVPPAWSKTSSPQRLDELVQWMRDSLWPNYHLPAGVSLVNVPTVAIPYDYRVVLTAAQQHPDGPPSLGAYALGHADSVWPHAERVELRPEETATLDDVSLWRLTDPLPRAWIVHQIETLPPLERDDPASIRRRTEEVFWPEGRPRDLRHSAVVETERVPLASRQWEASPIPDTHGQESTGKMPVAPGDTEVCRIVVDEPQRVELEVELSQPGLIILADQYYPGWTAEVTPAEKGRAGEGSHPHPILRTDRVLRGVWLEAGSHRLVFRYQPWTFWAGLVLSGLAWFGVATCVVSGRPRGAGQDSPSPRRA